MPLSHEIAALDWLTLREHTECAGDVLDPQQLQASIAARLPVSQVAQVRHEDVLVAYAMLHVQEDGLGFVTGFNTHPAHRNAAVFRSLFSQVQQMAERLGITALRSNVYKTNRLSMAFHGRLGFQVTRENGKGVEFTAHLADLRVPLRRRNTTPGSAC